MIVKKQKLHLHLMIYRGLGETLRDLLREDYAIQDLDIEDVFTDTQLSKIEQRENYLYISLQFPQFNREKRHFDIKEIHSFISHDFFITIDKHHAKHLAQFEMIKDSLEGDLESTNFTLFYEMLSFFVKKSYKVLAKFKLEIQSIENHLFDFSHIDDNLKEILIVKRNLINFNSVIRPLSGVILELQDKHKKFIDEKGLEELDDSLDIIKKILNNLDNFKEQMQLLTETNESLINRSTNDTLKVLTVISLIGILPTFLAGFFGMNVYFGWSQSSTSLAPLFFILSLMTCSTFIVYTIFKRKGWF